MWVGKQLLIFWRSLLPIS